MEELQPEELEELIQELEVEAKAEARADEAARHLERAFSLEDRDEYEEALEECETAIRLDPTLADAHNLRGVILEELGRVGEAVLAHREALRLDPDFDAARENLQAAEAELLAEKARPETHRADESISPEGTMEEFAEEPILFEPQKGDSAYLWLSGRLELLPVAGAITIYEYPDRGLTITIPVGEITGCEIVEREDIRYFAPRFEGYDTRSYGDVGCAFSLISLFMQAVEGVIAKDTSVPVLRLTQSPGGDSGQGWVIHLRSKKGGRRGQVETLGIAHRIVTFLRGAGYRGTVPEDFSKPTDLELSLKRKWFAGGILASLFSYVTGLLVAGYLVEPWNLSVSRYLDIFLDMYLGWSACCGLPGLALSLFVLGMTILRPKRPRRSAITVIVIIFAVLNLAIGCGVGMFNMLDLSRY